MNNKQQQNMQEKQNDCLHKNSYLLKVRDKSIRLTFRYFSPQRERNRTSLNSQDNLTYRSSRILEEGKLELSKKQQALKQVSKDFYRQNQNEIKKPLLKVYQEFHEKIRKQKINSVTNIIKIRLSESKNKRINRIYENKREQLPKRSKATQNLKPRRIYPHAKKIQITLKLFQEKNNRQFIPTLNQNVRIRKNSHKSESNFLCETPQQSRSKSKRGIEVTSSVSTKKHKSQKMTPSRRNFLFENRSTNKEKGESSIKVRNKKIILIKKIPENKEKQKQNLR